jgi:hypothetical protein
VRPPLPDSPYPPHPGRCLLLVLVGLIVAIIVVSCARLCGRRAPRGTEGTAWEAAEGPTDMGMLEDALDTPYHCKIGGHHVYAASLQVPAGAARDRGHSLGGHGGTDATSNDTELENTTNCRHHFSFSSSVSLQVPAGAARDGGRRLGGRRASSSSRTLEDALRHRSMSQSVEDITASAMLQDTASSSIPESTRGCSRTLSIRRV